MKINSDCAAVCGLFCGTCPSFINCECEGCLSNNCVCDCFNGFKDCAVEHGVVRCNECKKFPCASLRKFSTMHVVNGICHHENVISDLKLMSVVGVDAWIENQVEHNTCKKCGNLKPWFEANCKCNQH